MSLLRRVRSPHGFLLKAALAPCLVALADWLLYRHRFGGNLGLFALALTMAAILAHPAIRHDRRAVAAVTAASLFGVVQLESPSALAWVLFWAALMVAVLSSRAPAGENAWRWFRRVAVVPVAGLVRPNRDLLKISERLKLPRLRFVKIASAVVLPIAGGVVFFGLFSAANPMIGYVLEHLSLPSVDMGRGLFWSIALVLAWSVLRPRHLRLRPARAQLSKPSDRLEISTLSMTLSLIVFNAVFALQNGLDIAFLWSGAGLPAGMSLADYAHRGAYTLIVSALLAGAFVILALDPQSANSRRPSIRILVVLWVAQTILLVASSVLRTLDYVNAYSLTRLRIAALIWMGLVAVGLALICWRLVRAKSSSWLINANVLAAGLVLTACSVVDLGAVTARWNIGHARELGAAGPELDVCYLESLGDSALIPLAELEQRPLPGTLDRRVALARYTVQTDLEQRDKDWRSWTGRNLRRMARAAQLPANRAALAKPGYCYEEVGPTPAPAPPRAPLTSAAGR
jgi:hypothetical protein